MPSLLSQSLGEDSLRIKFVRGAIAVPVVRDGVGRLSWAAAVETTTPKTNMLPIKLRIIFAHSFDLRTGDRDSGELGFWGRATSVAVTVEAIS